MSTPDDPVVVALFPGADIVLPEDHPDNARIDPDIVLDKSIGEYREVVVVGRDHQGGISLRCSERTLAEAFLLIERARWAILSMGEAVD